jgi:hypothetical protein
VIRSVLTALAKLPIFESAIFQLAAAIGALRPTPQNESAEVERDIDAVYLWVNDQDPTWQTKRQSYLQAYSSADATAASRFRQFNELYCSIRLMAKNAPFIRRVYVIVDNQDPQLEELAQQVPFELVVVDHTEFVPLKFLPTFNTRAITANIHLISGLSEQFLYCNDDVFIARPSVVGDWFDGDKLVQRFTRTRFPDLASLEESESIYRARWKTKQLADAAGWPASDQMPEHAPFPLTKTIMRTLWETFSKELESTSLSKLRSRHDVLPEILAYYYAAGNSKTSFPRSCSYKYIPMTQASAIAPLIDLALHPNRFLTLCLNDVPEVPIRDQISEPLLMQRYRRTLDFLGRA